MSTSERDRQQFFEGQFEAVHEIQRLANKVAKEKDTDRFRILNMVSRIPFADDKTRPNGKPDWSKVYRPHREYLEELDRMGQDEFDTVMAIEAMAEEES